LDWDGEVLRVAQSVQRGDKAEISAHAVGRLGASVVAGKDDPAVCGGRLAQALAGLKLKPGIVIMGIPRGLVFLRTLLLPRAQTREEMASMVHFQISKDLPFRVEEAVIDFQVNGAISGPARAGANGNGAEETAEASGAGEKVEVLVAVVKREVVEFYERLAQAAGFKLAALGLNSYANARGLTLCGLAGPSRIVALVSLRQREVITDVVADGTLVFSRMAALDENATDAETVSPPPALSPTSSATLSPTSPSSSGPPPAGPSSAGGGRGPTAATNSSLGTIAVEVVRSLHSFEGLGRQQEVEEILVTGAEPQAGIVAELLGSRCGVPCRRIEALHALGAGPTAGGVDDAAFTVLSLALIAQDNTGWPFDFLHPKRPAVPRNTGRIRLLTAAAAAVMVVATALGIRGHLMRQRLAARDEVNAAIGLAAKNRPLYRQMRLKAKTVHDWLQEKREWLDHCARLSALLPDCSEVYVTSISTGTRGVLHISIRARSGDVLAQIDKRLRAAGYDLKPLAVTPSSDRYGYSFQSSLELTLPDKMKVDLASLKVPPRPADDGSLDSGHPPAEAAAPPVGTSANTVSASPSQPPEAATEPDHPNGRRWRRNRQ